MPECFISHVSADARLARRIHKILALHGVDTFLATVTLRPGDEWSDAIRSSLREARWVLFLASRAACASSYVQQEVGGAYFGNKVVVPIVWDIAPEELPGWARRFQAVDLRNKSPKDVAAQIRGVAQSIRASKQKGALIGIAVFAGLMLLASQDGGDSRATA